MVMRTARLFTAAALLASLTGCGKAPEAAAGDAQAGLDALYDRSAMLVDQAGQVVRPQVAAFAADAKSLRQAVAAWCGGGAGSGDRAAAQAAFKQAFVRWQTLEVYQFGPAAMDQHALRDRIYSWPLTSTCAVDQAAASCDPAIGCDASDVLVNRKGLDALEALLFRDSTDHGCPPQAAPAAWAGLDDATRWRRRCGWALAVATDLEAAAQALDQAWRVDGGDFVAVLSAAGGSGNPFPSTREAVNHWTDALFYVDTETKTMKLGQPSGAVANACGVFAAPCPAALESPHADLAKEAILANIEAFQVAALGRSLDAGGRGPGLHAWLQAIGQPELANTLAQQTDACREAVIAIPGTLRAALQSDLAKVTAAHDLCKLLAVTMKTSLTTTLGLDLPDAAAADAD